MLVCNYIQLQSIKCRQFHASPADKKTFLRCFKCPPSTGLCSLTQCLPHQYHFIPTALPWLKAQMYCREHYTDLATVSNMEDMNRLVNTARDSTGGFTGKAWIGLHDNLTSWRWSLSDSRYYGEKEADYRNWDFGQPDNFLGDQMCVKMWSGGVWQDSWCFLRNPFICYDGLGSDFTVLNSDLWRSFSDLSLFSPSGEASADQRFIFVEQELSWSDAQLYCRRRHTDLASVRNERENQEIQFLTRNRGIWIGLYRSGECDVSLFVWWRVTYFTTPHCHILLLLF